ncbi:sensor histidine kinase [Phyllobacterium myrsinacearum]|uniref:histidine kinase n=1 Tax=Phyllobacterium myrsinacearum TaxID=28101 RepID=A0A2S9JP95_9HYPH|nr:HAMP domain-containing sensor histidine kinase [Phyllobacterium myrsinacearum]PRD55014.1 sensor histidine kinase [Phyllobacterium myrsinacearum]PWV90435.1 signal transduction histidine kinase [Phyllobacterium myrsinacearum]RZV05371.1 signal transduction histidine kinase [Phyllobacterium myrsinacearum]
MFNRRSIAFPAAVLLVVGMTVVMALSTILTLALLVTTQVEDRMRVGPYEFAKLLRETIERNGPGELKFPDEIQSSTLMRMVKDQPSFWYIISDATHRISYGPVRQGMDQKTTDTTVYSESLYSDGGQQFMGVRIAVSGREGTVVEVGGISLSTPQAIWVALLAARSGGVYQLLTLILGATTTAAVLIVRATIAAPVRRVVRSAEEIDGLPNGRQLPCDSTPIELMPMVTAFNTALRRIDTAFDSQRNFLSNVAHELRTPLTRMRLKLERIQDENLRRGLIRDTSRLASIVTTMLQLARLSNQSLAFTAVNLVAVARAVVTDHAPIALSRGVNLSLNAPSAPLFVYGSEDAIYTAVSNLLLNSVQHATGTNLVTVNVGYPAQVTVVDHGPGIPPQDRNSVLRPFVRGSRSSHDGTGLGLAIVAQVMAVHGGSIALDDTAGGGATIRLLFSTKTL